MRRLIPLALAFALGVVSASVEWTRQAEAAITDAQYRQAVTNMVEVDYCGSKPEAQFVRAALAFKRRIGTADAAEAMKRLLRECYPGVTRHERMHRMVNAGLTNSEAEEVNE